MAVIFWPVKKEVVTKKIIKTIPASVVLIPTQDKTPIYSTTGAKADILPDDQYKLMSLINILRNDCPVNNDIFNIIYDYKVDKFVVTLSQQNWNVFLQWKMDTGYNGIADKYWIIKYND